MKKSGLLTLCFSLWLLTGCSAQEIAEWNQKISDLGASGQSYHEWWYAETGTTGV